MAKKGKPTEQIALRLPSDMLEQFRKLGKGSVSEQIRKRLLNSILEDLFAGPTRALTEDIRVLADIIEEGSGGGDPEARLAWYAHPWACTAFVAGITALVAWHCRPEATLQKEVVGALQGQDAAKVGEWAARQIIFRRAVGDRP
jgi:hypothetical protein